MALISLFKSPGENLSPLEGGKVLHVMIRNREKVIYNGEAFALSSVNNKGQFDVLAQHINFISIIKEYIKIHKMDKTMQEYPLRTGLMKVNGNRIDIFVGISELPGSSPEKAEATKPQEKRDILKRFAKIASRSADPKNPVV